MGEMAAESGVSPPVRVSISMNTSCAPLLRDLERIWLEIGESEEAQDRMRLELEIECMQVYHRKVDEASSKRAQLNQSLAAKEAEIAALMASLGENCFQPKTEKKLSLKEQLVLVTPLSERLKAKKEERIRQFADMKSQIEKISAEINGGGLLNDALAAHLKMDGDDLSIRRLNAYKEELIKLQNEKSERISKVLEFVNELHSLCGALGEDFARTVDEVHPGLRESNLGKSTSISDSTINGLSQALDKLRTEKKTRLKKLREAVESLVKLWSLMDSSEEERRPFKKVATILAASEEAAVYSGALSLENIKETEAEVERLAKMKANRMNELVRKRRLELEDICRNAHTEPDMSTATEKCLALIDSGLVDPCELLANIEEQIEKAKEEHLVREEIMVRVKKWLMACEEESWLEEYNQVENRYNAGRGAHMSLKRAEKARAVVSKIPVIVDNLMSRTLAWEDERNRPFLYDGVRLVSALEDHKRERARKEEERRQNRDQKKLQSLMQRQKEAAHGFSHSPESSGSCNTRLFEDAARGNERRFTATPSFQRVSAGGVGPSPLLSPLSRSAHCIGYFRETRQRPSVAP